MLHILPAIVTFFFWYSYLSLNCYLNGAFFRDGNCWLIPLQIAWEDFLYALPIIGRKMKGRYIYEMVNYKSSFDGSIANGIMTSESGAWDYEEIRNGELYEEVGCAMLPGFWNFFFEHAISPVVMYFMCYSTEVFILSFFKDQK